MKYNIKFFNKRMIKTNFSTYVLGADIGGTNANLAIAGVKNSKPILLFSLNFESKRITSFIKTVEEILMYAKSNYNISTDLACIGAAGIVSPSNDFARLTNVQWNISSKELTNETPLESVYIINDFEAIGFGINLLDYNNKEDIIQVRTGKGKIESSMSTKAIIGAGTGLGKCILTYDRHFNAYIPIPSEGGHADFPVQTDFEKEIVDFIKKLRGISQPLTYEEVVSGRGLESIYQFFRNLKESKETTYTKQIDNAVNKTHLISKYKTQDDTCRETFRLFTRFYARCAKNYVLDTLARGGLYISGGIASKNKEIFSSKDFLFEFEKAYRHTDFLKEIPINIIINYDVSIYGACYAAVYRLCNKKLNKM
jgi:glucokinase